MIVAGLVSQMAIVIETLQTHQTIVNGTVEQAKTAGSLFATHYKLIQRHEKLILELETRLASYRPGRGENV